MHIGIAGNIGSGKTSLTELLAKHFGWTPHYEQVATCPYNDDYYKDMQRWALNMEVYYLKERFRDLLRIAKSTETVVQDRTIYEGVYIFATANREMGNISERDFDTFMGLFESMMMAVRQPDLLVYLRASVPHLVQNIQQRARAYEQNMQMEYLIHINQKYEDFVQNHYSGPKLIINMDELDFVHSLDDRAQVLRQVGHALPPTDKEPTLF